MLFMEIIAVVCENHRGDTNKLYLENAQLVNIIAGLGALKFARLFFLC
jgi:hypothetical protein